MFNRQLALENSGRGWSGEGEEVAGNRPQGLFSQRVVGAIALSDKTDRTQLTFLKAHPDFC